MKGEGLVAIHKWHPDLEIPDTYWYFNQILLF